MEDYIIDLSEEEFGEEFEEPFQDDTFADEGLCDEECALQASQPSPARPQKRNRTESPELSPGADCELEFEGDHTSDEEFIPRNAKLARPALMKDLPFAAHEEKASKVQRLPSQLQALLPTSQLSAPRELDAANVLTEQQTKAVQYVASMARPKSQNAEPGLQRRLSKWGYSKDTLTKVLAYIRDEAPIVIHVDLVKYVSCFQADTHYRNQFETRTTGGSSDLGKRKAWESRLFPESYDEAQHFDRVKYGVLNAVNDPRGIVSVAKQYGQDYLVLRGARLRTTFSDRDSCTQGQQASCEWYAHVLEKYTDAELQAVTEVALGDRLYVDSTVLDTAAGGYKEVQIHGEIEFKKHIEAVVVHPSRRKGKHLEKIEAWCRAINVPLLRMPEYCDGTAFDAPWPQASGSQLVAETPLWRWRPLHSTGPWVRFDVISSSVLEARRRDVSDELPCLPAGNVCNLNLSAMTARVFVDRSQVELSLQRRTAGAGARERASENRSRNHKSFVWEWCASASGHGSWCAYDAERTSSLEKAWCNRASRLSFSMNGVNYNVDFELMVQVNCETRYRRLVRRRPA